MEVTPEEREDLRAALEALDGIDPAALPEPAARLAELLSEMLDATSKEGP